MLAAGVGRALDLPELRRELAVGDVLVDRVHLRLLVTLRIADHGARLGIDAGEEEEAVVEGETQSAAAPEPVPMQEPEGGDADDEPLPDTGPQAHVVPAPDTQAIETIEPITLPAPEEASPATKRGRKASAPLPVCAGITERTLPDGRIAFRASPDDAIGKEALSSLCKGKAVWNPMFSNWLCLPDIAGLVRRAGEPEVKEIILATGATVDGQTTAHYIADRLAGLDVTISRLAHGVPVGGELDYLDDGTLTAALKARRPV